LFGCCRLWQVWVSVLLAQKLQVVHLQAVVCLFQFFRLSLFRQVGFQELELAQGLWPFQAVVAV